MFGQNIKTERAIEEFGLYILRLSNIKDYLDYMSFWKPRGGLSKIINSMSGSQAFLLRHALGRYTCPDTEDKGVEFVYTSLILKIPKTSYQTLPLAQNLDWLARKLAEVHYNDLKGKLLKERYPTYMIVPDENMEPGTAEFLFGDLVFLPCQEDRLVFSMEFGLESPGAKMYPVQWNYSGMSTPVPAGMYDGQINGIRIGLSPSPYAVAAAAWGKQSYSRIHIIPENGNSERLNVYVDDKFFNLLDLAGRNEAGLSIPSNVSEPEDASDIPLPLVLRFKRVEPASESDKKPVDKKISKHVSEPAVRKDDPTFMRSERSKTKSDTDLTFRYGRPGRAKVKLEGFLMPRLDKVTLTFSGNDLASWVLWFDDQGNPYLKKPETDPALTLSANNREGVLFFKESGDNSFRRLTEGYHEGNFQVFPPPSDLNDLFLAILEIPIQTRSHALKTGQKKICGRSSETDFSLSLLNVEGSLKYPDGTSGSNWDRMLTSSRHIELELLEDGSLKVTQLSRSIPVYVLDRKNELLEELPRIQGNLPGKSAMVNDGQKIGVGGYLLRFEGSKVPETDKPDTSQKIDQEQMFLEPIFSKLTSLLDSFLKESGSKDHKPDIGSMTRNLLELIDTFEAKQGNTGFWRELRDACHSVRTARNRWAHPVPGTMTDNNVLENLLSLKRSLDIFRNHMFSPEFLESKKEAISELETIIQNMKKVLLSRMGV